MAKVSGIVKNIKGIVVRKDAIKEYLNDIFLEANKIHSLIKNNSSAYFSQEEFTVSIFKQEPALTFRILSNYESNLFVIDRSFGLKISPDNKLLLITVLGSLDLGINSNEEEFNTKLLPLLSDFKRSYDSDTGIHIFDKSINNNKVKFPAKAEKIDDSEVLNIIQNVTQDIRNGRESVDIKLNPQKQQKFILKHESVLEIIGANKIEPKQNETLSEVLPNSAYLNKSANETSSKNTTLNKVKPVPQRRSEYIPPKNLYTASKKKELDLPLSINSSHICFQDSKNTSLYNECIEKRRTEEKNFSSDGHSSIVREENTFYKYTMSVLIALSIVAAGIRFTWKNHKIKYNQEMYKAAQRTSQDFLTKIEDSLKKNIKLPANAAAIFKYVDGKTKNTYDYFEEKIKSNLDSIQGLIKNIFEKASEITNYNDNHDNTNELSEINNSHDSFNYDAQGVDDYSFGSSSAIRNNLALLTQKFREARQNDEVNNLLSNELEKIISVNTNKGVISGFLNDHPEYMQNLKYFNVDFIKENIVAFKEVFNPGGKFNKLMAPENTAYRDMIGMDEEMYIRIQESPQGRYVHKNKYALFLVMMLNKLAGSSAGNNFEEDFNKEVEAILNLDIDSLKSEQKEVKITFNNNSYKFLLDGYPCVEFGNKYFEIENISNEQVILTGIDNITPAHEFDCQIAQKI